MCSSYSVRPFGLALAQLPLASSSDHSMPCGSGACVIVVCAQKIEHTLHPPQQRRRADLSTRTLAWATPTRAGRRRFVLQFDPALGLTASARVPEPLCGCVVAMQSCAVHGVPLPGPSEPDPLSAWVSTGPQLIPDAGTHTCPVAHACPFPIQARACIRSIPLSPLRAHTLGRAVWGHAGTSFTRGLGALAAALGRARHTAGGWSSHAASRCGRRGS